MTRLTEAKARRPVLKISRLERIETTELRERIVALLADEIGIDLQSFSDSISDDTIRILLNGTPGSVSTTLAQEFAELDLGLLRSLESIITETLEGGVAIGRRFGGPIVEGISIPGDVITTFADTFVENQGLELARNLNASQTQSIQETIRSVVVEGLDPTDAIEQVRDSLTLDARSARSLRNFETKLVEARFPGGQENLRAQFANTPTGQAQFDDAVERINQTIRRDVANQQQKLLENRASVIVENEVQTAINAGERLFYEEAIAQGEIGREAVRKVWRTVQDARVCPICEPLEGKTIGFDETFQAIRRDVEGNSRDETLVIHPPAHARCRCFIEYQII